MLKFFRIHYNKDIAKGCYSTWIDSPSVSNCNTYHVDFDKHPLPENDALLYNNHCRMKARQCEQNDIVLYLSDYHYGFKSINQFRAWFYDDDVLLWMHENNYVITEFDVNEEFCHLGYSQMIAILSECKLVKTYSLREFVL